MPQESRKWGLRCAAIIGLMAIASAPGADQPPVRQVLVLQSFDRGNLVLDHFTTNLRVDLDQRMGGPVNYIQITVGPTGFVGAPDQSVVEFIRSSFANRPGPDLIVTVAGPASVFARKYRQQLFPETPLLFAAVDQRYLGNASLGENETAVTAINGFSGVVDDILQVRPKTRHVFVIIGSGIIGKFWRFRLEEEFNRLNDRVTFTWSDDLSLSEVLRRCATLPKDSAIFYITFGTDAAGAAYADERVMDSLHETANAPIFAAQNVFLGHGIVGGRLIEMDKLGRRTADSAQQLLNGVPPSEILVSPLLPGEPVFDWRELQRWDIPESRLPPGSEMRFRGPTLWSEHSSTVVIAIVALAIQALLIVGMLFERRARRKAELESHKNLSLAADTSRRETMSALTTSISHEISQPLSSMIQNAEALKLMIATNRATWDSAEEILSDIHNEGILAAEIIDRHRAMMRNRQLEKRPIDLRSVVEESLTLVAHDMKAREVETIVNLSSKPFVISGDQVLLQQVLVNLVMNAMDAMAETPPDRRRITISSVVRGTQVEVSVRDAGPGLPADLIDKLFTPFVTTKPRGLGIGLAIARSIVEAHGGGINAGNHPEGGAIFTVTLRVGEAHGILPTQRVIADGVSETQTS